MNLSLKAKVSSLNPAKGCPSHPWAYSEAGVGCCGQHPLSYWKVKENTGPNARSHSCLNDITRLPYLLQQKNSKQCRISFHPFISTYINATMVMLALSHKVITETRTWVSRLGLSPCNVSTVL